MPKLLIFVIMRVAAIIIRNLCVISLLLVGERVWSQSACPVNIGFEAGNFSGWQCLAGRISSGTGEITLAPVAPIDTLHVMLKNKLPQDRDKYGGFPVNCPNGSGYSIKLGDDLSGGKATGVSYTFTIPAGDNDFSVIYNYAVVLQNPQHLDYEQPKFTTRVFDVTANKYLTCASFEFVASGSLPGFQESSVEKNIFYKDWAPVTMKLTGYAGKTIRIEFTVNDCSRGVHFGYAYLDVDENCSAPISGNTFCNGSNSITLKAPYGFKEYNWYTDDMSTLLGTGNFLKIEPLPPAGTKYALDIVPFAGQGCRDTLRSTITTSPEFFILKVKDTIRACGNDGIDLTAASIIAGSTPGLIYNYYSDAREINFVPEPKKITKAGVYYVNAKNASGCSDTKPISLLVKPPPQLKITPPFTVCLPGLVDLTSPVITAGSEPGLTYSYWNDTTTRSPVQNPSAITSSGTYFIKATDYVGCITIVSVKASLANGPKMQIENISSCGPTTIRSANPTAGSDTSVQYTYWADAGLSIPVPQDSLQKTNRSIYIKGVARAGCTLIKPFDIKINRIPSIMVKDPAPVTRPASIDLAASIISTGSWSYAYWTDPQLTQAVPNPNEVIKSGVYYIQALDITGCDTVKTVNVIINDPPIVPPNAFSPNNDGINDLWLIPILSYYPECTVEIFTRSGRSIYRSTGGGYQQPWDGKYNGTLLPIDTYFYVIKLAPGKVPIAGSVTIIR